MLTFACAVAPLEHSSRPVVCLADCPKCFCSFERFCLSLDCVPFLGFLFWSPRETRKRQLQCNKQKGSENQIRRELTVWVRTVQKVLAVERTIWQKQGWITKVKEEDRADNVEGARQIFEVEQSSRTKWTFQTFFGFRTERKRQRLPVEATVLGRLPGPNVASLKLTIRSFCNFFFI